MHTYLQRLQSERDSLTQTATALAERAADEDRDLTDQERQQLAGMQERCADLDTQLTTYSQQLDSQRAYAQLRQRLSDQDEAPAPRAPRAIETRQPTSWGQLVTDSEQFRGYHGYGRMDPVEVPLELRSAPAAGITPIMTTDFDTGLPKHTWTPPEWTRTSPFLDAVGTERVSSGSVEWLYWPPPDPVAQEVAEGAAKPQAEIPHEEKAATLATYAHWAALTRQVLDDIPRIRSIVETKLRNGLVAAVEAATADAIAAAPIPAVSSAGGSILEAIRIGMADVQSRGWVPNAVLLNPTDWASIDIGVMGGTLLGPTGAGNFWAMRPVAVPALPAGTAYVGDFNTGVTLFDRGAANVFVTDSHTDLFVRNILVILAETRALPAVTTPAAMAKIGGTTNGRASSGGSTGTSTSSSTTAKR